MIAANDLLFVADGDNLFRSVQSFYGKDHRVSYLKLRDFLKHGRDNISCFHLAIFVTIKADFNKQLGFVGRLSTMGYDVKTFLSTIDVGGTVQRQDTAPEIIKYVVDFRCRGDYPGTVVLASASGAFADLYSALGYQGIAVEVFHFGDTPSKRITDVSRMVQLDESLLYTVG